MQAQPLVLVVDDDAELSAMVCELLAREGWAVHAVLTGGDGERALARLQPEVVLLDVMLPDANGLELCRRWRASHPALGLLMLTARGDPLDRVLGLEIGADDYLPKTASPRELLARLRAVARRSQAGAPRADTPEPEVVVGPLRVNPGTRVVLLADQPVALTAVEFDLLLALARTPGRVRSREQLLEEVRDRDYEVFDRSIDVHVSSLRRKLGDDPRTPRFIETVRSVGYRMLDPEP